MGSASSMLTQYDIEEVQEHCNDLCGYFFLFFFLFLSLFHALQFAIVVINANT